MSAVIVSVRVACEPEAAFDAFTGEIGAWWRPAALFQLTPRGDGALRFEDAERLVTTLPNGKTFEIGRVLVWLRGERLAFSWRQASFPPGRTTQVEVRFHKSGEQTRVTIEHRGWDEIPQASAARHGFPLHAIQMRLAERWRDVLEGYKACAG